jgi:hypothetical protein
VRLLLLLLRRDWSDGGAALCSINGDELMRELNPAFRDMGLLDLCLRIQLEIVRRCRAARCCCADDPCSKGCAVVASRATMTCASCKCCWQR